MFYYPAPYFSVHQYTNPSIVSILLSIYYDQLYFISLPISIPAIQLDPKPCTLSFTYTLLISLSIVLSAVLTILSILLSYTIYYSTFLYHIHTLQSIQYQSNFSPILQLYTLYPILQSSTYYILYCQLPSISTYHTFIQHFQ